MENFCAGHAKNKNISLKYFLSVTVPTNIAIILQYYFYSNSRHPTQVRNSYYTLSIAYCVYCMRLEGVKCPRASCSKVSKTLLRASSKSLIEKLSPMRMRGHFECKGLQYLNRRWSLV